MEICGNLSFSCFVSILSSMVIYLFILFQEYMVVLFHAYLSFIVQDPSIISLCFCSNMEIKNKAWQVSELEDFRNSILQENQLLKENISSLQLQIKELESVSSARISTEITKVFSCIFSSSS